MNIDSAESKANSSFQTPKVIMNSYSFNNIKKAGSGIVDQNQSALEGTSMLTQTLNQSSGEVIRARVSALGGAGEGGGGGGGTKRKSNNLSSIEHQNEDNPSNLAIRKGGPPKTHYHKLPSAFAFSSIPPTKKLIKPGILQMGLQSRIHEEEENIAKKIDNLVDVSEYKQIQNLLSPLKMREGKVVHNKQKKLFSFHEQSGGNPSTNTSSQQSQAALMMMTTHGNNFNTDKIGQTLINPLQVQSGNGQNQNGNNQNLIVKKERQQSNNYQNSSSLSMAGNPLREYMETMQKFKDQFKETPDLLLDKINSLIMKSDNAYAEQKNKVQISSSSNNLPFAPDIMFRKALTLKQPKEEQSQITTGIPSQNIQQQGQTGQKSHSSLGGGIIQNFKVKLEEMITLSLLTSNKNSGAIKKMLHAPTLAIFAVKEQPIGSKEVRKILRDWLQFWPAALNSNEQFIRVYGTCWNVPEGCVSIIMEHVNGGSLQNLLENVGNLNERALQELSMQVLSALYTLHTEHGITHGNLSPSQILFNKSGYLKLSLGITSRTHQAAQNNNNENIFHTISNARTDKKTLFDHSSLANVWSKNMIERQEEVSQKIDSINRAEEVFKFGLLLLVSAIGSLDLIDDSFVTFFEQVQKQIEIANKESSGSSEQINKSQTCNCSCLLHDEENLISLIRKESASATSLNPKEEPVRLPPITIQKLLSKFSDSFRDMLYKQIHSTLQPTLGELIAVSNKISMQTVALPDRYQGASERQLDRVCEGIQMILPNCQAWFKVPHYTEFVQHLPLLEPSNAFILALANDLGMQSIKVHSKIIAAYDSVQIFKDFKHKFIFKAA